MTNNDDYTKLSSSVTVRNYKELEHKNDKAAISCFIKERFEERYFKFIDESQNVHGFTQLAICCLVIETLESFYQGRGNTKNFSAKMFSDFFSRETPLKVFASSNNWFYSDIRCGILHQGETLNGWRIRKSGSLLDNKAKTINAKQFTSELRKAVTVYAAQLIVSVESWKMFKKKMKVICRNCI